ncbi:MAG: NAD(P)-dependent oxidoreductase [Patescibacteria group bacterium]|nr:NAD(P)-dependent oxidoreductase [Patescibacteria group bacterium]
MKIVITDNLKLAEDQIGRLKSLGEIDFLQGEGRSKEERLRKLSEADIICAESVPIADIIYDLKNKFISLPFVGVGWLDLKKLAHNNVKVANAPGCNKSAVAEWIVGMMIILSRKLLKYINIEEVGEKDVLEHMPGLAGKKVVILGKGNVGIRVGKICEVFDMEVSYFKRGGDLINLIKQADFVVNCLANNPETKNLLDKKFFESLKEGAFFVSITDTDIYNVDALIGAIDSGRLKGAAIDPAGVGIFNTKNDIYSKLRQSPKIIVTPHIAFHTDMTCRTANDIMIDNVEAWIKKKPINLVN